MTIQATDPTATWSGNPGIFTVYRQGNAGQTLNVYYEISGTASNGVDYQHIGNIVSIPGGVYSSDIVITPIDRGQSLTKTVTLTLTNAPTLDPVGAANPVNYVIGSPSSATVSIAPGVKTNLPPVVRITSPADGATFRAPVNIPIYAYARDPDGSVSNVEFFAGSTDLGPGHPVTNVRPPSPPGPVQPLVIIFEPTNYWEFLWTNPPPSTNALTAVATDNRGLSAVSDAVHVTILPPPPPPPNRPPIVSISAIDPIAIEGTNCWPWLGLAGATPTWANWTAATAVCRYFTNCGPKNAIFAVRRFGETNDDLAVTYDIGGTATNGVDYVTLPGVVTIPAGTYAALITVVPIDDGPPDITSTVILTLTPSTNTPPAYLVGCPARAAAIILDSLKPPPVAGVLPDKTFHVSATGPNGAWFHIEYSTDLLRWTPICSSTNQVFRGGLDFVDPDAQSNQIRFYRAVPEANPPAQ